MTPAEQAERERLVAEWRAAVKRKQLARTEAVDAEFYCDTAERRIAAYDAAHKEEAK